MSTYFQFAIYEDKTMNKIDMWEKHGLMYAIVIMEATTHRLLSNSHSNPYTTCRVDRALFSLTYCYNRVFYLYVWTCDVYTLFFQQVFMTYDLQCRLPTPRFMFELVWIIPLAVRLYDCIRYNRQLCYFSNVFVLLCYHNFTWLINVRWMSDANMHMYRLCRTRRELKRTCAASN